MFKKMATFTSLCLASGLATAEPLQQGIFVGANVGYVQNEEMEEFDLADDNVDYRSYELSLGYKFNNWLGVDFRFGNGLSERDFAIDGSSNHAELGIDGISSYYYRGEFTNEDARLYILIGQSSVDTTTVIYDDAGNEVASADDSLSGLSYGLGAGWYYDDNFSINLEYRLLLDDDDAELTTINLGFDYRFNVWKL
ncbi:hypothetical protein TDB9533_02727 [Thalassocella blandensis]|nr:hypothetical protein TDB9533_02727 [Thalassocella blandensis]